MSELKTAAQLEKDKQEELNGRVQAFNGKLIALLGEYKLALGAVAFLLPDGRISARPHVFNDVKPEPTADSEKKPEEALEKVD